MITPNRSSRLSNQRAGVCNFPINPRSHFNLPEPQNSNIKHQPCLSLPIEPNHTYWVGIYPRHVSPSRGLPSNCAENKTAQDMAVEAWFKLKELSPPLAAMRVIQVHYPCLFVGGVLLIGAARPVSRGTRYRCVGELRGDLHSPRPRGWSVVSIKLVDLPPLGLYGDVIPHVLQRHTLCKLRTAHTLDRRPTQMTRNGPIIEARLVRERMALASGNRGELSDGIQ